MARVVPADDQDVDVLEYGHHGERHPGDDEVDRNLPALGGGRAENPIGAYRRPPAGRRPGAGHAATSPRVDGGIPGVERGDHLADQDAHGCAGWPEAGEHQYQDGHQAYPDLHDQVDRERRVATARLEQPAVEREQHEERRRGEDGRDADAALLVQQQRHPVAAGEDHRRPQDNQQGALAVHSPGPAANQVSAAVLVPDRHPAHHRDHHRGARHGDDEEQAGQLVQHAVAVRVEQPCQRDRQHDAGAVGDHARDGQRPRLQQPGADGLDARFRSRVEEELRAEIRTDRIRSQRHRRGHPFHQEFCRSRLGFDVFCHERRHTGHGGGDGFFGRTPEFGLTGWSTVHTL